MFHGFHLVEQYHHWKREHRSNRNTTGIKVLKLILAIAIPLFFWIAPSSAYGLPGLLPVEHRVLAIFVFAALMWLFDAVPAWTTSLVVVVQQRAAEKYRVKSRLYITLQLLYSLPTACGSISVSVQRKCQKNRY